MPTSVNLNDWACDACGRVYNPVLRDRFFAELEIDGEEYDLICDDCRRDVDEEFAESQSVSSTW